MPFYLYISCLLYIIQDATLVISPKTENYRINITCNLDNKRGIYFDPDRLNCVGKYLYTAEVGEIN
jgi:hypothetical protein